MFQSKILASLLLSFCTCIAVNAEDATNSIPISIAAFHFPPLSHIAESGRVSGTAIETVRALCIEARLDCSFEIYPVVRAYRSVENRSVDILMTVDLPRFSQCCVFTKWAYDFSAGIFTYGSIDDIPNDSDSLLGKSIVIVREWQTPYVVFPDLDKLVAESKVNVVRANSVISSIKMHQRNRAPLLWGSRNFDWYYKALEVSMEGLKYKALTSSPSGMWVSKQLTNYNEIVQRLNLANKLLHDSGSIDASEFLSPVLMNAVYEDAAKLF